MPAKVELCGHGEPLLRGGSAQYHVWVLMIVIPQPLRGVTLHSINHRHCASDSYRTVRLKRSTYAFCCGWRGWMCSIRRPRAAAQDWTAPLTYSGPTYCAEATSRVGDRVRAANNAFGRQREIHVDNQCLTVEIINHLERPNATLIDQLIIFILLHARYMAKLS